MTSVHAHPPRHRVWRLGHVHSVYPLARHRSHRLDERRLPGRTEIALARCACTSPTPPRSATGGFVRGSSGATRGLSGTPGGGFGARPEVSDHTFSRKKSPTGTARRRRLSGESNRRASLTLSDPTTIRRRRSSTGTPLTSQLFMIAKHAAVGRSDVTATTPRTTRRNPTSPWW